MRARDQRAFDRFSDAVETPMLALAVVFGVVLLIPLIVDVTSTLRMLLEATSWLIWGAFAAEYLVKLHLAPDKGHMVRTHVFDLAVIVLPFLRPLRAARALRGVQALAAFGAGATMARRIASRRGFSTFLGLVLAVVVGSGLLTWAFERRNAAAEITSPIDGVWWALVTATTVGYGDMVPTTDAGRGVAVILLLLGVALLSVVTANIAAFFVEEDDADEREHLSAELAALHRRFDELTEHLATREGRLDGDDVSPPSP